MGFIDSNLVSDEKVILVSGVHWSCMLVPILSILLGAAFYKVPVVMGILWFFGFIVLIRRFTFLRTTEYALTSKRVVTTYGLFSRNVRETSLSQIEGVNVRQPLIGKIFNYGYLVVGGTGGRNNVMPRIREPFVFKLAIQNELEALK